jgi:hypothetical protein
LEATRAADHRIKSLLNGEETMRSAIFTVGLTAIAFATAAQAQQGMTDDQIIAKLASAAPPSIVKEATIGAMESDGKMRTIRQGTNGFTCMITPGAADVWRKECHGMGACAVGEGGSTTR